MAEPLSFDPFALWRELVSQMEKGANDFAATGMKSDEFASAMNQALSASVAGKALKQAMLGRCFEALNLPTRSDIEALSGRLQAVEDRLIGLQTTLDRLAGVQAPALAGAMPSRTRKPPTAARKVRP